MTSVSEHINEMKEKYDARGRLNLIKGLEVCMLCNFKWMLVVELLRLSNGLSCRLFVVFGLMFLYSEHLSNSARNNGANHGVTLA